MNPLLKRGLLFAALLVGLAFPMVAQSTYVHVTITLNDGTEATYDMQSTSYMYFEEGVKLVITESSDGTNAVSYPLADIRKITCEEMVGTIENTTMVWPSSSNGDSSAAEGKGARAIAPGQIASVDSEGGQRAPQSHAAEEAVKLGGAVLLSAEESVSSSGAATADINGNSRTNGQIATANGQIQISVSYVDED